MAWMKRHRWRFIFYGGLLLAVAGFFAVRTVHGRLVQYGIVARHRLRPAFARRQVPYPPSSLVMVGVKDRRQLQLYAPDAGGTMRFIRAYPILGMSGQQGPKLREGDMQVPEGVYGIESLNPKSAFHLALRVSYPNAFDRAMARRDRRTALGGDIMIHGGNASTGCLAMGNPAAEDLFVLTADTGPRQITVIISPVDFRTTPFATPTPTWTRDLYADLKGRLQALPLPDGE